MALVEYLNSTNLEMVNQDNDPTFRNGLRLEANDITLRSFGVLGRVKSCEVLSELSLSDHRHILFTLQGSLPVCQIRNSRGTKWDSFWEDLRNRRGRGP
jgi:hypothetical protein